RLGFASAGWLVLAACSDGELGSALKRPETFVREIMSSERTAVAAQTQIESALRATLAGNASERDTQAFVEEFRARFPAPGEGTPVQDEPLSIERYSSNERAP